MFKFTPSPMPLFVLLLWANSLLPTAAAPADFVAVAPDKSFILPPIVLQHDPTAATGYDWETLNKQPHKVLLKNKASVVYSVRYLREAVRRMTGKELQVTSGNDLARGIVITTLAGAPDEYKNDPKVIQALRNTGEDAYNANEAFFIRSEPQRLVIVANTEEGIPVAIAQLLESVGYEVLGMGPNWTHVPDYANKPLVFSIEQSGRAGFYIRQLGGAAGQPGGIGTLFQEQLNDPADETVEVSYYQRWLIGTRMASKSMPYFPGHALQNYHRAVIKRIKETGDTAGLLIPLRLGAEAERPPASPENSGVLWINTDPDGQPGADLYYLSNGTEWTSRIHGQNPGGALDLSVPYVRTMILEDMKQKAQAHFEKSPEELFVFGTDPEDSHVYDTLGDRLYSRNWYPEYLAKESVKFPQPYVLNGFKGLNQQLEMWDPNSPSDTVFGFNNWLLREFDKWIDSLPPEQQITSAGKPKKERVRASLYSYNHHDVPPNFNLDPRLRVMIAGYPKHRGAGKWRNFATSIDMAQAFQKLLPREPSGDYWILSIALQYDMSTDRIEYFSKQPATLVKRVQELYQAGFRAITGEMDFNFGRLGLDYYLYPKIFWNPRMSVDELSTIRDRWFQRSFGGGWQQMKQYYDFMAPESNVLNAPNKWAKAIRMIDAAAAKIDKVKERDALRRLDDLKQYWYFYYLVESGQGKSDSPAMREFLWKGQMSYMTPMHMVAGNIFKTSKVRSVVGEEFSAGPAHYTHEETLQWWKKVLDFWKVAPVSEFPDATLSNGQPGRDVDINDLVPVRAFQSATPSDRYFYYDSQAYKIKVLTAANAPGEEIGFKLSWPYNPKEIRYSAMDVAYGISRWNPVSRQWEDLVDISMNKANSKTLDTRVAGKEAAQIQMVEVRFAAPVAGTYRIDIGTGGNSGKLGSLAFDPATETYTGVRPFSFSVLTPGYTQSPAYFYIPKGTKSLDFEVWGKPADRTLQLYSGRPAAGMQPTRTVDLVKKGTQRVTLNSGEDGSLASFGGNLFNFPQLYSVPQIWAKSPDALLVPRKIAEADGLDIIK